MLSYYDLTSGIAAALTGLSIVVGGPVGATFTVILSLIAAPSRISRKNNICCSN